MEKEIPLYEAIYNKIVHRILVGIYPKGYQLSSAQKIHAKSGVGYTSIRRALRLLEQDGFIRQEERKRPTVIFDLTDPRCRQLRWQVFLSHAGAHLDCYRAIPCILPGLVDLGARECSPQLLESLDALCAQKESDFSTRYDLLILAYTWQSLVVRQADNQLAGDLFLQIRGFDELRFTTLSPAQLVPGEARAALESLRYWTDLLRRGELEGLHTMIHLFCLQAMCCLDRSFCPLADLPEYSSIRQVDFRWYVRQSPMPLYKKIAYDLLRTACLEGMDAGDSFPSEAALMDRYGVAAVTVRGAVALLNSLGLAQTVNGVGTLFTGAALPSGEITPYLQEGWESMAILAAVSGALAGEAAPRLSRETLSSLREELPEFRGQEGMILLLLRALVSAIPSGALETVFEQLESRYIFGLYASGLPFSPGRRERLERAFLEADACLSHLEAGESRLFSQGFSLLCRDLCQDLLPLAGEGDR